VSQRGGRRPGAGRKPSPEGPAAKDWCRVPPPLRARIAAYRERLQTEAGIPDATESDAIRALLDAALAVEGL
jgi:hypothetical protein